VRCIPTLNPRAAAWDIGIKNSMVIREQDQSVETSTEARLREPGPAVAALLAVSTGLAMLILGVLWFVFFR